MNISSIYSIHHPDIKAQLTTVIEKGCQQAGKHPLLFFRADDIGVPSQKFFQLIDCFKKHKFPLCLATVPTWTTKKRLTELQKQTGKNSTQWCWHQHGRQHRNFEPSGKKQEFGPTRTTEDIQKSLQQGKTRLEGLLHTEFTPIFTPPWNRCSETTLTALPKLGFSAISRSRGATPKSPADFPDFQVNVDLHTRKEVSPLVGMAKLLSEVESGLASGRCGIMIHHQRMNKASFIFLDLLLGLLQSNCSIAPVHFGEMISN